MKQQIVKTLKVVGVIVLGGFILGGLLTFGARYIRYEETGDLFKIGGNLKIEGTCDGCVPSGMIAMFAVSCPTGWTRFTELDGKFPRGASTYGATGGSDTHSHLGSAGSAGDHSHTYSGGTSAPNAADSGSEGSSDSFAADWHGHTYSGTTSGGGTHSHSLSINSASNLPPYREMVFCKKN